MFLNLKGVFAAVGVLAVLSVIIPAAAERLAYDDSGNAIQALALGTVQTVSYTASSAATANVVTAGGTNVVRVVCTTDCHVAIGSSPTATASDTFLPANTVEYFRVRPGVDKVAFIRAAADGTAYVTEMD